MLQCIHLAHTDEMKGKLVELAGKLWDSWGKQMDAFGTATCATLGIAGVFVTLIWHFALPPTKCKSLGTIRSLRPESLACSRVAPSR